MAKVLNVNYNISFNVVVPDSAIEKYHSIGEWENYFYKTTLGPLLAYNGKGFDRGFEYRLSGIYTENGDIVWEG